MHPVVRYASKLHFRVGFCPKKLLEQPKAIKNNTISELNTQDKFNMAYMRYTDQWCEIFQGLTLDQCIEEIKVNPLLRLTH